MAKGKKKTSTDEPPLARRHVRFGWCSLLVFVTLGLILEAMHGFKIGWYLDVSNETRRLMWTLAHAHGTLLALLNLVLAATMKFLPPSSVSAASKWLIAASVLMPAGFLLGGWVTYGGDPGIGIVLVALGGLMLFVAILFLARGALSGSASDRGVE